MLAEIKKEYDWNCQGAEVEYQASLTRNPSYTAAHLFYAGYLPKWGGVMTRLLRRSVHANSTRCRPGAIPAFV
jgi:hypothetical protein